MKTTHLAAAMAVAALLSSGTGRAESDPLTPLAFLAGHCWTTHFADGLQTDTHCYEWMHGGKQLRDRHVVLGKDPAYRGETIYAWHGGRKRIEYRYWNSQGGQSDGYVEAAADGAIHFLDDHFVEPDGAAYDFASELTRPDETHYRMVVRNLDAGTWHDISTQLFERGELKAGAPQ